MLFSCGEIRVFIDHRLQQCLGGLLCLVMIWFLCAVVYSTKTKLGEIYIQVPDRVQTSA